MIALTAAALVGMCLLSGIAGWLLHDIRPGGGGGEDDHNPLEPGPDDAWHLAEWERELAEVRT